MIVTLHDIAHGRSGDKGDTSNITVFARKPEYYELIKAQLTPEAVKQHFKDMVLGDVIRYDLPHLNGFNFVIKKALGGGATLSLRLDTLGKSMGSALMRFPIEMPQTEKALKNIVVLDLTRVLAGPYCGSILGDFGAEVIKIEVPGVGDDSRAFAPRINGESLYYSNLNRNKKGMTLDLRTREGQDLFKKLVLQADIVLENYRPQTMEHWGLGYDTLKVLNPRLIYGAVSGFGATGPYSDRPGYDIISQAMGGLMSITGQTDGPPTRAGNAMGDILGGLNLTIGILLALNARHVTGQGQKVDVALTDSVISSLEQAVQRYITTQKVPERMGSSYAAVAPYDVYACKDGFAVIACGNQKLFEILCNKYLIMSSAISDPRFINNEERVKHKDPLREMIESKTKLMPVDQVVESLLALSIPAAPIFDLSDITKDPHFKDHRKMFVDVDHPVMGKVTLNGTPIKLSDTPTIAMKASPVLGQHTDELLQERLGLSTQDITQLRNKGIL